MIKKHGAADGRVTQIVVVEKLAARVCRGWVGAGAGHCLLFCSGAVVDKDVTDDGSRTSSFLATPLVIILTPVSGGRWLGLFLLLTVVELVVAVVLFQLVLELFINLVLGRASGLWA